MSNDLITFHFHDVSLNAIEIAGDPWFVLADVCKVLEYRDAYNASRNLDDDEKGTHIVSTPGGNQEMTIISESGLYALVLTSRKPQAKPFQKWVTTEVIPSIRKTGRYSVNETAAAMSNEEKQFMRMKDHLELQRKHIAALQELDVYRRRSEDWVTAQALIDAGVDDPTICRVMNCTPAYAAWVRSGAEVQA